MREVLQKGYKELQKLVSIYLTEKIRWWKLLNFPLCLKIKFLYMKQKHAVSLDDVDNWEI